MFSLAAERYIQLLRPTHWIKNLLVFAALIFSQRLTSFPDVMRAIALFGCFCAISSAVYIFNDWVDAPADRLNPDKASRPLAAGTASPGTSLAVASLLATAGLAGSWFLNLTTFSLCLSYVVINVLYSLRLKKEPILDVGCIASGFVLRAFAGATVIDVPISRWLVLCTIFLSLFLGFAKRRQELNALKDEAPRHRAVLKEYSNAFLDHMMIVAAAAAIVCYTLYTVDEETVARFGTENLIFTIPFVLYGIFRYLYLIHQRGLGGSPTEVLLRDPALGVTVVGWAAAAWAAIYL